MSRKSKKARPENAAVPRFNPSVASSSNCGWQFVLFLVAATLIAYLPVWHAGFIWDDDYWLTGNPLIKDPHGWYRFWFTTRTPDYYPLTSSAFWLEWRLWGMNAAGYHAVNVLLHAVNSILLWRVLSRLKIHKRETRGGDSRCIPSMPNRVMDRGIQLSRSRSFSSRCRCYGI